MSNKTENQHMPRWHAARGFECRREGVIRYGWVLQPLTRIEKKFCRSMHKTALDQRWAN